MFSVYDLESKSSFEADTQDSSIKAPRPKPMETQELPPEFKLEENCMDYQMLKKQIWDEKERFCVQRKGSLDNHYSILAFIDRKIKETNRQRIMSEQIHNLRL